jgi:hypothetical protein
VVAGTGDHVHEAEDRLLRAGEGQHLVGVDGLVQRRDLGAQERVPSRLRVPQAQAVPQGPRLVVGERDQLRHGVGLDVRGAEQVLDREFPASEEPLEREVGDAHRPMMAHGPADG